MDLLDRTELKEALRKINDLSGRYDFDTAIQAMEQVVELGQLTSANSIVLAVRLAKFEPEESSSVKLGIYDNLLEQYVGGALQ